MHALGMQNVPYELEMQRTKILQHRYTNTYQIKCNI